MTISELIDALNEAMDDMGDVQVCAGNGVLWGPVESSDYCVMDGEVCLTVGLDFENAVKLRELATSISGN